MDYSDDIPAAPPLALNVAICLDEEVYHRLRPMLRHFCVGLIDYNVSARLVTPTPIVSDLAVGPIGVELYDVPRWPARIVPGRRRLAIQPLLERMAERPPNVVFGLSHNSYEIAAWIADTFDTPLVLEVTSLQDIAALTDRQVALADHFVAVSRPLRDILLSQFSVPDDQVDLIHPGLLAAKKATCFPDPDRVPTILSTAPLVPHRGADQFIEAGRILLEQKKDCLFFLTGAGPSEWEFRHRINSLGLSSRIIFAHPAADLDSIMVGADIYVEPSRTSSLSSGVFRAMANGMAVVGVEGGVADMFVDGENSLVCRDGMPDELAKAIGRLLDDPPSAVRLAEGAIAYMKKNHSLSGMVEQTVELMRRLALPSTTFSLPH